MMTHSGTASSSRTHDRRLRTLVEPEAAFLAQLVHAMRQPVSGHARDAAQAASERYATIAETPVLPWPHAGVSRRV
jgi:hypothetical protein